MKLKNYLAREGMSAAEFAREIEMSEGMVSLWVNDKSWPSKASAERILRATKGAVTPGDFLSGVGRCA